MGWICTVLFIAAGNVSEDSLLYVQDTVVFWDFPLSSFIFGFVYFSESANTSTFSGNPKSM